MTPALLICAYALAVGWFLPELLAALTAPGMSARLGLTAWLTSMACVLACFAVALQYLLGAAVTGWPLLAQAICRSATGHACPPLVYRGAILEIPLSAAALGGALAATVLAWQYGRRLQRSRRRTRAHAESARITGRALTAASGTVVLDVQQPAAYCVPGRPPAIVLTAGALAVLEPAQLTAVIAHEKAHLAGGHHRLVALTRGLAAILPRVPLFTRGAAEVERLAEMRADDRAARDFGRPVLVTALLAMGTGTAIPVLALAATAQNVTARVHRLLAPPPRARHIGNGLALVTVTLLVAAGSALIARFAGPLAAHALAVP